MPNDLLLQALIGPPTAYWEALGRFVSLYSMVEESMQAALWRCAGVKPPVAPAIFSGTRAKAASEYIDRIAEAQRWPKSKRAEIKDVFKQLSELTQTRNDILHYGASMSGPGEWVVDNKLAAHVEKKIRRTKISVKILNQMSEDAYKIMLHVVGIEKRGKDVPAPPSVEAILKRAWLYRPVRQSAPREAKRRRRPRSTKRRAPR